MSDDVALHVGVASYIMLAASQDAGVLEQRESDMCWMTWLCISSPRA